MEIKRRTKTIEQCRAEAILLGLGYYEDAHVYSANIPQKKPSYLCAETLEVVPVADVLYRRDMFRLSKVQALEKMMGEWENGPEAKDQNNRAVRG